MEFIIHGTTSTNLMKIIKDGYIDNTPNKHLAAYDNHPKQIFTNLMFKGISNQATQVPFWYQACVLLDKKILIDQPFYSTKEAWEGLALILKKD